MTSGIKRRLDSLERQLAKEQAAAEKEAFFEYGRVYALAYYLGRAKSVESLPHGFARALEYDGVEDLSKALVKMLQGKGVDLARGRNAYRRLFYRLGVPIQGCSESRFRREFLKMINALPKDWLTSLKAIAAKEARNQLEEARFDAWYDELLEAEDRGEISRDEAMQRLAPWIHPPSYHLIRRALELEVDA